MAKFLIPDHSGHSTLEFDLSTDAGVKEAMEKFEELVKEQKLVAGKRTASGESQHIRSFDPTAEETIFARQIQGG